MMPFWTAQLSFEAYFEKTLFVVLFSNKAHNALHFLSERCFSRMSELLKVKRAEIPYSFVSVATACGFASPKPTRPPPHKQSLGAP